MSRLSKEVLATLVSSVTETMVGMSFTVSSRQDHPPARADYRTAILSIAGASPLDVGLSADQEGCSALAAALFSCPTNEVDGGMMEDSLGEILNMTAGTIKRALQIDHALGLPRMLLGVMPPQEDLDWKSLRLQAGGKEVELVVWISEKGAAP